MTSGSLRCLESRPMSALRLVCFPHAGAGTAAYRAWPALLPAWIEPLAVQYPGREDRFGQPPVTAMAALADAISAELTGLDDRPLVFFGHSMGAAVAHEVGLRLMGRRTASLARLVVSAREPPQHVRGGVVHLSGDEALRGELARLGGTSPLLLEDAELWELMAPVIRADYQLIETYRPRCGPLLDCPVTAFAARADQELTICEAADWAATTHGAFDLRIFPGDHFYLLPLRQQVVAALVDCLRPHSAGAPSQP